jgi:hypothetical protein
MHPRRAAAQARHPQCGRPDARRIAAHSFQLDLHISQCVRVAPLHVLHPALHLGCHLVENRAGAVRDRNRPQVAPFVW